MKFVRGVSVKESLDLGWENTSSLFFKKIEKLFQVREEDEAVLDSILLGKDLVKDLGKDINLTIPEENRYIRFKIYSGCGSLYKERNNLSRFLDTEMSIPFFHEKDTASFYNIFRPEYKGMVDHIIEKYGFTFKCQDIERI